MQGKHPARQCGVERRSVTERTVTMTKNPKILSIVLAGGEGTRLMPLTRDRAKPAVPFGGVYRLIDFPLSNLVNPGTVRSWCSPSTSLTRLTATSPRSGVSPRCLARTSPLCPRSSVSASTGIWLRRRHLPDHQHHRGCPAGHRGDRGADHVYRMDFGTDGTAAHRVRRRVHRGRYPPAHRGIEPVRCD